MPPDKTRVLIADPDVELLKSLGAALSARGFEVLLAKDGSKALECSILKTPDIVLIDRQCPLIDATRFAAILRANPRTENTPLIVMSTRLVSDGAAHGYLDGQIQKPFNVDEVVAQVQSVAHKLDTAQSVKASDRAVVGNLGQIALVDLLQIFSMNRKTGVLKLRTLRGDGDIAVEEGRIKHARLKKSQGPKALFRLLAEVEGEFSFAPGRTSSEETMQGATDSWVMEGLRQIDELQRLLGELPSLDDAVERVPGEQPAGELHPTASQLLEALSEPRSPRDLFELVPSTDFEAAQALQHLFGARLVRHRAKAEPSFAAAAPILPEALVLMLRSYLQRALPNTVSLTRPRVLVLAEEPTRLSAMIAGLHSIAEFRADVRGAARYGFGTLGLLPIAQDLAFELVALPVRIDLLPAAVPLSLAALGIICLSGGEDEASGLTVFRETMIGRLGIPWLEVAREKSQTDESDPRALRGMLAALCRALTKT